MSLVLVALASVVCAGSASAQIINTLRGFERENGWSGSAAAAFAVADGNTEYFELEGDARIQYQTDHHRLRLILRGMRRTAGGDEIAQSRIGHLRHNYLVLPKLASVLFLQGQYDPYLRLQTRILAGAGGRVDIITGDQWNAAAGAALMHESEELTDDDSGYRHLVRFSFFATLYRLEEEGLDVDLWAFYQPVADDFSNVRLSAAASLQVDLVGELYFFANYVIRHNSNPPATVKKRDQSARSGLGIDF